MTKKFVDNDGVMGGGKSNLGGGGMNVCEKKRGN